MKFTKFVAAIGQPELALNAEEFNVADHEVSLAGYAVGNDRALHIGDDGLHVRFVKAQNGCAVKWNAVNELRENFLNFFERLVRIEVLAINGRDDGHDRRKQ